MGDELYESMERYAIAADLWTLLQNEGSAGNSYTAFLAKWEDKITKEAVAKIRHIISEETSHVDILEDMLIDTTGITAEGH